MKKLASRVLLLTLLVPSAAFAQQQDPGEPSPPPATTPTTPTAPTTSPPPVAPAPSEPEPSSSSASPEAAPAEEQMSEGRMLVSAYNSGFQWGIAPGVIFSEGKTGFALGLRFGYGFDTGPIILVPGVRLAGYFTDPNVYLGMPTFKLVLPIDRFAPFVEGGAGLGHVADPPSSGLAVMGGVGFMIHFTHFAFGAEGSYQVITGTDFKGFGVGPILAFAF